MAKQKIDSLSYWSDLSETKTALGSQVNLKQEIVKNPKEVLKNLNKDVVIATNKKNEDLTIGDVLAKLNEKNRSAIVSVFVDSAIQIEKAQKKFITELTAVLPKDLATKEDFFLVKPQIPIKPQILVKPDIQVRPKILVNSKISAQVKVSPSIMGPIVS